MIAREYTREEQAKRLERKTKFHNKINDVKNWASQNKQVLMVAIPVVGSIAGTAFKFGCKRANLRKEQNLKDLYFYDRSMGHYWKTKRKLSTKEMLEFTRRKNAGESVGDILDSMNVLK